MFRFENMRYVNQEAIALGARQAGENGHEKQIDRFHCRNW